MASGFDQNDCLDAFKLGCDTCGNTPCCCGKGETVVQDSRGDCVPVLRDPDKIIVGNCKREQGGDMTIKAPQYELTVENPPDDVLRDENGAPILVDGKVVAVNS